MITIIKRFYSQALMFAGTFFCVSSVLANPVLGNVGAGNVSFQQSPNSLVINQASPDAIINWQSFNIGQQQSTHFQQPAGGVALNRIDGSQGASQIYGRLSSTGEIILVNPAGIYFGPSSYVNVGGLIATTADINNSDFLNHHYQFSKVSPYSGSIINDGTIISAQHGLIALVGAGVENNGMIKANLGHVVLASGEAFTVNFAGDDLINFAITQPTTSPGKDRFGNNLKNGVSNTGTLIANGGQILVTANTASSVLDNAINMQGVAMARSIGTHHGEIIISGSPSATGGVVRIAGKLIATGKHKHQTGGNVTVTGNDILLDSGSLIDVSGNAGGGNINIGGDYHGEGPLPNANAVVMAPTAVLKADAIDSGNGGNIILWSQDLTKAYGSISAQGGANGGNGGFVETSSHHLLDVSGLQVNTLAPYGTTGTWLLDPENVTISTTSPTSGGTFSGANPNVFTPTADNSNIVNTDIDNNLATANVTITTGTTGTQAGNITVNAPISWSAATALVLNAANDILINSTITGSSASSSLSLTAQNASVSTASPSITTGSTGQISVGTLTVAQGILDLGNSSALGSTASTIVDSGAALNLSFNGLIGNGATIQIAGSGVGGTGALTATGSAMLNNSVALSSNAVLGGSGNLTIYGALSGNSPLTVNGVNLNLTNINNTYTGGTLVENGGVLEVNTDGSLGASGTGITLNAGTLKIGSGNFLTSRAIVLGLSGGTLDANGYGWTDFNPSSADPEFNGVISGAGSLTFINSANNQSIINLTANNTYTGNTIIEGGTVGVGQAGIPQYNVFGTMGTIIVPAGAVYAGIRSAAGVVRTVINNLTLDGNLTVGRVTNFTGNITLGNNVTLFSDNPDGLASNFAGGGNSIFSGVISGASANTLTIENGLSYGAGAAAFVFSGNNTYSGLTTITGGTLQLANANALNGTSAIIVNPAVASGSFGGAQLDVNFSGTLGNTTAPLTLNAAGITTGTAPGALTIESGQTATFSNPITLASNSSVGGAGTMTLNGAISGTGGLTKLGTSFYSLGASNSSYTGATTINDGILQVTNVGGLGNTSGTTVNTGTALDLAFTGTLDNSSPITLNSLGDGSYAALNVFNGLVTLNNPIVLASASTMRDNDSPNPAFLTLNGVVSGAGNLTLVGLNRIDFDAANTYTGTTTISGGAFGVGNAGALGATSSITIDANASINYLLSNATVLNTSPIYVSGVGIPSGVGAIVVTGTNVVANNPIILTGNTLFGGTGSLTLGGAITQNTGPFSITKVGTGFIGLAGVDNFTGSTTVDTGTLGIDNIGALNNTSGVTVVGSAPATLDIGFSNGTLTNTSNISIAGNGVGNNGVLTGSGTNAVINNPVIMTANSTIGGTGSLTLGNVLSGSGFNLSKAGTGTIILNASNTYSGTTTIANGILELTNLAGLNATTATTVDTGATLFLNTPGTLSNTPNTITLNGTGLGGVGALETNAGGNTINNLINLASTSTINNPGSLLLNGVVSGAGGFTKIGAGTLTLAAANTYAGVADITAGALNLTNLAALGSASTSTIIENGAALDLGVSGTLANASNTITLNGTGNPANTGALVGNASGNMLHNNIVLASNSTINDSASTLQLTGNISGSGQLTKIGTGTTILSGTSSYTGGTVVTAGTVSAASANGLGANNGNTLVDPNAVLNVNNVTVNQHITLDNSSLTGTGTAAVTSSTPDAITLTTGTSDTIMANSGNLAIDGSMNGAAALTLAGPGTVTLGGNVGNTTPLTSIVANTVVDVNNSPTITTQNNQTYNDLVTLLSPATFSMVGSGVNDMYFNAGINGANSLTLTSGPAGNYNYFINGPVTLSSANVDPDANSSNNSLHLNNVGVEDWLVNNVDAGLINITGVPANQFSFSNISSAYAGTDADSNFIFAGNTGHITQLIDAGSLNNTNTLNYSAYTSPVVYDLIGNQNTGTINDGHSTLTNFENINNIASNTTSPTQTLFANTIQLPINTSGANNTVTVSGLNQGSINDPVPFDGIKTFISQTGADTAVFLVPATFKYYLNDNNFIATINGVEMYFINFPINIPVPPVPPVPPAPAAVVNVANIILGPNINAAIRSDIQGDAVTVVSHQTVNDNLDDLTNGLASFADLFSVNVTPGDDCLKTNRCFSHDTKDAKGKMCKANMQKMAALKK